MPEAVARVVDVRTSPVQERIAAVDDFVRAGFEVHLNFSPVILYEGWERDYRCLFEEVDAALSPQASEDPDACEVEVLESTNPPRRDWWDRWDRRYSKGKSKHEEVLAGRSGGIGTT